MWLLGSFNETGILVILTRKDSKIAETLVSGSTHQSVFVFDEGPTFKQQKAVKKRRRKEKRKEKRQSILHHTPFKQLA